MAVPGVSQFVPLSTPQDSPAIGFPLRAGEDGMVMTTEDINTIHRQ